MDEPRRTPDQSSHALIGGPSCQSNLVEPRPAREETGQRSETAPEPVPNSGTTNAQPPTIGFTGATAMAPIPKATIVIPDLSIPPPPNGVAVDLEADPNPLDFCVAAQLHDTAIGSSDEDLTPNDAATDL